MEPTDKEPRQRIGNAIYTEEITQRFKDYAAIVFHACNKEKYKIEAGEVPVIYATDVIGGGYKRVLGIMGTKIEEPKNK